MKNFFKKNKSGILFFGFLLIGVIFFTALLMLEPPTELLSSHNSTTEFIYLRDKEQTKFLIHIPISIESMYPRNKDQTPTKLTREQTETIIKEGQAEEISGKAILAGLIERGYEPEGIDINAVKKISEQEFPDRVYLKPSHIYYFEVLFIVLVGAFIISLFYYWGLRKIEKIFSQAKDFKLNKNIVTKSNLIIVIWLLVIVGAFLLHWIIGLIILAISILPFLPEK